MMLSLIVPLVSQEPHLITLLRSVGNFFDGYSEVELVLVNQSGASIYAEAKVLAKINILEIMTDTIVPAASARNLGADQAHGKYLFFLDDDAVIQSGHESLEALLALLAAEIDIVVCQRGHIKGDKYISHWNENVTSLNQFNFSSLVIEWNFIVKKSIFNQVGKFVQVGAGSKHAALSGEAFILMVRLLKKSDSAVLLHEIKVSHPSLIKQKNQEVSLLGYFYGAGYSVGASFKDFTVLGRAYWFFRVLMASLVDLVYRYRPYRKTISGKVKFIGIKLFKCRLIGFFDGVFSSEIKTKNWLSNEASK